MASFMSYFTGRRDSKQSARDAIVALREQLITIEKKEEHLQRQIAQDVATAKANAVSNKSGTLRLLLLLLFSVRPLVRRLTRGIIYILSGYCCTQTKEDARSGS